MGKPGGTGGNVGSGLVLPGELTKPGSIEECWDPSPWGKKTDSEHGGGASRPGTRSQENTGRDSRSARTKSRVGSEWGSGSREPPSIMLLVIVTTDAIITS